MLLSVNTVVHLEVKVELPVVTINGLAEWAFNKRQELMQLVLDPLIRAAQEKWLESTEAAGDLVCTGCGVVHQAAEGWVRRGTRRRRVKTSSGMIDLPLLQVTCRDCGSTRTPCAELLGLEPRSRTTPELARRLVERVYDTSYRRSARTAKECMGISVSPSTLHRFVQERAEQIRLTPDPKGEILLADGTPVRAGKRHRGGKRVDHEEMRLAFQIIGRTQEGSRSKAELRMTGIGVGLRTWPEVLPGDSLTKLVVTDGEPALQAHIRARYPNARHQQCEWHLPYAIDWSLRQDGLRAKERRPLQNELRSIIWADRPAAERRAQYQKFIAQLTFSPSAQHQLRQAAPFVLFDVPSAERTTSLIERQMREVDRRVLVGVRWSIRGVRNLMLLSMARTHNPDDYSRAWIS